MTSLAPLESLYEVGHGDALPLPAELAALYGILRFPRHPDRPHVIGNFVMTLDGIASLEAPGQAGSGPITGFNQDDRMVAGLLRSVADAVIVGAGTLRSRPDHVFTAEAVCPTLADAYRQLRAALGKTEPPLLVVVAGSGNVDPQWSVFRSGAVPALIVAGPGRAERIGRQALPPSVQVAAVKGDAVISPEAILDATARVRQGDIFLVEGGSRLFGRFFLEQLLDELFFTLAPQVAGRDDPSARPGPVAGTVLSPGHPRWGTLVGVKRGMSHLFLRYAFEPEGRKAGAT
jgi:riboflavin biosynthesis pyrimidine reductase